MSKTTPDKDFPSSKPNCATPNGIVAATPNGTAAPTTTKPQLHHPYRPQPQYPHHHRHHRRNRNLCRCCCFWTIVVILAIALLAAIAGAALYLLYNPHRPHFSISSLRIGKLNLTTTSDASSTHLSSVLNLTLSVLNPNSHLSFFYDPFTLSCFSNSILVANSSIPAFNSAIKNDTVFRAVLIGSEDLYTKSATDLKSNLKRKSGFPLKIQMNTKVKVKIGGFKSKKVGIRVECEGIKGFVPKGKSPSVASVSNSKCNVDLRIKIWKLTF